LRRYKSFITAKCDGGRSCYKAKSFVKPLLRNYLCFDNFLQPINMPSKPYIRRFVSRLVTQGCRSSPKTLNVSICLTSLCFKAAECFNFGIFSETSTELSKLLSKCTIENIGNRHFRIIFVFTARTRLNLQVSSSTVQFCFSWPHKRITSWVLLANLHATVSCSTRKCWRSLSSTKILAADSLTRMFPMTCI